MNINIYLYTHTHAPPHVLGIQLYTRVCIEKLFTFDLELKQWNFFEIFSLSKAWKSVKSCHHYVNISNHLWIYIFTTWGHFCWQDSCDVNGVRDEVWNCNRTFWKNNTSYFASTWLGLVTTLVKCISILASSMEICQSLFSDKMPQVLSSKPEG